MDFILQEREDHEDDVNDEDFEDDRSTPSYERQSGDFDERDNSNCHLDANRRIPLERRCSDYSNNSRAMNANIAILSVESEQPPTSYNHYMQFLRFQQQQQQKSEKPFINGMTISDNHLLRDHPEEIRPSEQSHLLKSLEEDFPNNFTGNTQEYNSIEDNGMELRRRGSGIVRPANTVRPSNVLRHGTRRDCTADPNLWAKVWSLQQQHQNPQQIDDEKNIRNGEDLRRIQEDKKDGCHKRNCQEEPMTSSSLQDIGKPETRPLKSALKYRRFSQSGFDADEGTSGSDRQVELEKLVTKSVSYDDTVFENDGHTTSLKGEQTLISRRSNDRKLHGEFSKRISNRIGGRDRAFPGYGDVVNERTNARYERLVFRGTYPIDMPIKKLNRE